MEYCYEEYRSKSGIENILSKFIRRKTYVYRSVYSYTYNGKEYETTSFDGLYSKERKAGDYVTIRVKKDNPSVIYEDLTWKDIKKIVYGYLRYRLLVLCYI